LEEQRFVFIQDRVLAIFAPPGAREFRTHFDWKIVLRVSEFLEMPTVAAATDLLGIFPRSGFEVIARIQGLRLLDLPFAIPGVPILLIWHEARCKELAHSWLRRTVRDAIRRFAAEAADAASSQSAPMAGVK
jgi:DNA-binding transcriptional LysR family regulator